MHGRLHWEINPLKLPTEIKIIIKVKSKLLNGDFSTNTIRFSYKLNNFVAQTQLIQLLGERMLCVDHVCNAYNSIFQELLVSYPVSGLEVCHASSSKSSFSTVNKNSWRNSYSSHFVKTTWRESEKYSSGDKYS